MLDRIEEEDKTTTLLQGLAVFSLCLNSLMVGSHIWVYSRSQLASTCERRRKFITKIHADLVF